MLVHFVHASKRIFQIPRQRSACPVSRWRHDDRSRRLFVQRMFHDTLYTIYATMVICADGYRRLDDPRHCSIMSQYQQWPPRAKRLFLHLTFYNVSPRVAWDSVRILQGFTTLLYMIYVIVTCVNLFVCLTFHDVVLHDPRHDGVAVTCVRNCS